MSLYPKRPQFSAFNPHAEVRVYHRNLPHWRQDGATYFVTFRLGDSIPKQVLLKWRDEDSRWLKIHGVERSSGPLSGGKGNGAEHRSTDVPEHLREEFARRQARRMHVELDTCYGCCLLRDKVARDVLSEALHHFHEDRLWLGDYVIMPNHVHVLLQPIVTGNGPEDRSTELEHILASIKGYVSTQLTKLGLKKGMLWQQENYDRLVRDREELNVWRKYIRLNPEKAKLRRSEFSYFACDWM